MIFVVATLHKILTILNETLSALRITKITIYGVVLHLIAILLLSNWDILPLIGIYFKLKQFFWHDTSTH